jgi:hypothetical protein
MTRRKREIAGLATNRTSRIWSNSHFRRKAFAVSLLETDAFHRERRIPVRRGRSRHEVKQVYIRFCFPDAGTAEAFRNRFGGECLTHAPAV